MHYMFMHFFILFYFRVTKPPLKGGKGVRHFLTETQKGGSCCAHIKWCFVLGRRFFIAIFYSNALCIHFITYALIFAARCTLIFFNSSLL